MIIRESIFTALVKVRVDNLPVLTTSPTNVYISIGTLALLFFFIIIMIAIMKQLNF